MTFSTMYVEDNRYCLCEKLFAATEPVSRGSEVSCTVLWHFYEVPEGTEIYSVWESDFYNASCSYVVYKYDWQAKDWEIIDYAYADYENRDVPVMMERCKKAKQELCGKGMIEYF